MLKELIIFTLFISANNINKIFVSIPRFQEGIPVALGTITNKKVNGNPVIKPYPSWRWHTNPKVCANDRIVSVYRVQVPTYTLHNFSPIIVQPYTFTYMYYSPRHI